MFLDLADRAFFPRSQRKDIERLARCEPESVGWHATHWSFRSLAEATVEQGSVEAIDHTTIREILYAADLRLPLFRFWKTTVWTMKRWPGHSKSCGITNESRVSGSAVKSCWRPTRSPTCKCWNGRIRSNP